MIIWNNSLSEGDISTAEKYTSDTSWEYIKRTWGSLAGLSKKYQAGEFKSKSKALVENVTQDNSVARVVYTVIYNYDNVNVKIKTWEDILFYEDGLWKLAPQFAIAIDRKELHDKKDFTPNIKNKIIQ